MKFLIKKKDAEKQTLYLRIHKRNPNVDMTLNTEVEVETEAWLKANKSVKEWDKYAHTPKGKYVTKKLELIEGVILNLTITSNDDRQKVLAAIREVVGGESILMQRELERIRKEEQEKRSKGIITFVDNYKEAVDRGIIRSKGRRMSESFCKTVAALHKYVHACVSEEATFDEIDDTFVNHFIAYMDSINLMAQTKNIYITLFKKICAKAIDEGACKNIKAFSVWKPIPARKEDKKTEIYLNEEEIDALYNMELKGIHDRVRDIFLLGYFTSQRHSDYSTIRKENIVIVSDDVWIVNLRQQKTGVEVDIPITDKRFMKICKKYDFDFPSLSADVVSYNLHYIMKELAETVPSLKEEFMTVLTSKEVKKEQRFAEYLAGEDMRIDYQKLYYLLNYAKEHNGSPLYKRDSKGNVIKFKYEMVSSHTARRSGITNMYKAGLLDTREMRSISGHKTEEIFENYIKMGTRENALRIADKLLAAKKKE